MAKESQMKSVCEIHKPFYDFNYCTHQRVRLLLTSKKIFLVFLARSGLNCNLKNLNIEECMAKWVSQAIVQPESNNHMVKIVFSSHRKDVKCSK